MSDDSDNEISSSPLYKDREEWNDIKGIYNDSDEDAVVRITHNDTFNDAFAYFRAILHKNELSDRAFELTTSCSQLNPANYSVWQFRRNLLQALKKDIKDEFKFCEEMIYENPKNYQIWHHRRILVEWTSDSTRELDFTKEVLRGDSKNYHAWQHRIWVVDKFDLFTPLEIAYTTELIVEDIRNNSAWNYRFFVVSNMSNSFNNKEMLGNEIKFAQQAIQKASCNESSWCYLNGILVNDGIGAHTDVVDFCKNLHEDTETRSVHLRCLLFDYHVGLLEKSVEAKKNSDVAFKLLDELIDIDAVRKNYYTYLRNRVNNLLAG